MIQFHPVTLNCKASMDPVISAENSRSADFNFGNIYIWDKRYRQLICRIGDRIAVKLRYEGKPTFVFPIGTGPLRPAIEALHEFADYKKYPFTLRGITEENLALLESEYPGCFEFTEDTSCADYIYSIEKLSTYSGKALHGKKNHCNRFEAEHKWEFTPITREIIPKCLDMLLIWDEDNAERLDKSISYEHDAIIRAFAAYEELELLGGVLIADGEIVGFSIGEPACSDTFDVHFEKAVYTMNGAYPMVCREMSRLVMQRYPDIRYINREDDMGFETLRQSKLSYKPEYLLKKYTARWIDG
ncbi:MAG: DUF2156 domain-containing protein [Oscillospiraceae bacterium]|nr:DUF2156 domain-containing protein [Oscillospiraceae bacterium]